MTKKKWSGLAILFLWMGIVVVIGAWTKDISYWESSIYIGAVIGFIATPVFGLSLFMD